MAWLPGGLVGLGARAAGDDDVVAGVHMAPIRALLDDMRAMATAIAASDSSVTLTGESSVQVACYPGGGARYAPHLDAYVSSAAQPHRVYTLLYYLNDAWQPAHGGCLRVHLHCGADSASGSDGGGRATARYWHVEPMCVLAAQMRLCAVLVDAAWRPSVLSPRVSAPSA
jgi:hypothetical protein